MCVCVYIYAFLHASGIISATTSNDNINTCNQVMITLCLHTQVALQNMTYKLHSNRVRHDAAHARHVNTPGGSGQCTNVMIRWTYIDSNNLIWAHFFYLVKPKLVRVWVM